MNFTSVTERLPFGTLSWKESVNGQKIEHRTAGIHPSEDNAVRKFAG